jgi:hypothetical protein
MLSQKGRRGMHINIQWESQEERRQRRKPTHRRKDNTKIYPKVMVWGGTDWIDLIQDRELWQILKNMVMKLHVL